MWQLWSSKRLKRRCRRRDSFVSASWTSQEGTSKWNERPWGCEYSLLMKQVEKLLALKNAHRSLPRGKKLRLQIAPEAALGLPPPPMWMRYGGCPLPVSYRLHAKGGLEKDNDIGRLEIWILVAPPSTASVDELKTSLMFAWDRGFHIRRKRKSAPRMWTSVRSLLPGYFYTKWWKVLLRVPHRFDWGFNFSVPSPFWVSKQWLACCETDSMLRSSGSG